MAVARFENGTSKTKAATEKLIITPKIKLMPVIRKKITNRIAGCI
jgi:hypothetical protein